MHRKTIAAFSTGIFLALWSLNVPAQDAKTELFREAETARVEAAGLNAEFFSPVQFQTAVDWMRKAESDFQAGRNMEDLQKKLKMAAVYWQKSSAVAREAQVVFKDCIKARNDARLVEAPALRKTLWEEAESMLSQACRGLEEGDSNGAKNKSRKAERSYRQAELEAIKANYLDGTRELLKKAEAKDVRKRAPLTLAKAGKLADRAESQLVENRYDTDEARQLAQEAQYEAKHALFLNDSILALEKSKASIESVLLAAESPVRRIADAFDQNARFDTGSDGPVNAILQEIRRREQIAASQEQALSEKSEQISALQAEVSRMQSQLGALKDKEADLTQAMDRLLDEQRVARERLDRVEKLFTPDEAQILRSGSLVILRLTSITFPVGKSVIEPGYFGLLTKVTEAFTEYPESRITVEGHTDSRGGDEANLKLSTERAEAVREYLLATGSIDASRLFAAGYGESRPIASNDTEEGRKKNRRIDVVIDTKP
jgi:OmpA-OmpF porin, OOP family